MKNGIILAGGQSLRFGEDKAFAKIGNSLMIESLICLLLPLFPGLIVVTNFPDKYRGFPVSVVEDEIRGIGPLGGIYSGLLRSDSEYNFVCACDMPYLNPEFVRFMLERDIDSDAVIPRRSDKIEPLCAVYSKKIIPKIKENIAKGRYKIQDLFGNLNIEYVEEDIINEFDPDNLMFLNVNSKKDLKNLCLKRLKSGVSV